MSSQGGLRREAALELAAPCSTEHMSFVAAESLALFGGLSEADLRRKWLTPTGSPITTWKWLRSMVEHEAHHRGQLYLMASMRGLAIPPLYGLTEEQVLERSHQGTGPER